MKLINTSMLLNKNVNLAIVHVDLAMVHKISVVLPAKISNFFKKMEPAKIIVNKINFLI